jgi:hypothetical protein
LMGFDGYVSINARRDFNARKFWLASFVRILIEPYRSPRDCAGSLRKGYGC